MPSSDCCFLLNTCANNYYNPTTPARVTARNVRGCFFETQCIGELGLCPILDEHQWEILATPVVPPNVQPPAVVLTTVPCWRGLPASALNHSGSQWCIARPDFLMLPRMQEWPHGDHSDLIFNRPRQSGCRLSISPETRCCHTRCVASGASVNDSSHFEVAEAAALVAK